MKTAVQYMCMAFICWQCFLLADTVKLSQDNYSYNLTAAMLSVFHVYHTQDYNIRPVFKATNISVLLKENFNKKSKSNFGRGGIHVSYIVLIVIQCFHFYVYQLTEKCPLV